MSSESFCARRSFLYGCALPWGCALSRLRFAPGLHSLRSSHSSFRVSADGSHHSRMSMTSAKNVRHGLTDIGVAGLGIAIEISLGGHNDAIHAESALHCLFVDECFLNRMRLVGGSQTFQGRNLSVRHI